jgi:HSP20 family protein
MEKIQAGIVSPLVKNKKIENKLIKYRRNKMNIVTWKPWKMMRPFGDWSSMHNRINRLFEDSLYGDNERESDVAAWYPSTDIYETQDEYVFKLEVPGLTKEDIKIELKDSTLSISGERKEETEVKKEDYHRIESCSGKFYRNFSLPRNIDPKKVNAKMKDGILELRISKSEEAKPQSIPIEFN